MDPCGSMWPEGILPATDGPAGLLDSSNVCSDPTARAQEVGSETLSWTLEAHLPMTYENENASSTHHFKSDLSEVQPEILILTADMDPSS